MQNCWRGFLGLLFLGISLQLLTPQLVRADELAEILREKGVITKEDWIRIQADEEKRAEEQKKRLEEEFPVTVGYGKKGLEFATRDGKYKTQIQWRMQFRYYNPFDGAPRTRSAYDDNRDDSSFRVRRARIKVGGHGYETWLKYYFEHDWPSSRLLDWRLMLTKFKWAQLRVGQWKINYNRERVDSSGKQQFVERSIVNREFTLDRQQGAQLYGRLFPGTWGDSWYVAGVYNGTGRGENNDDKQMMYMGRFQWNFLGRDLKFSQSDVSYHEKPAGSIAFGAATNKTACSRFSSGGCGGIDLQGVTALEGRDGQYRVQQMVEEFAFKWRGLSLQHEWHWKEIKDRDNGQGAVKIDTQSGVKRTVQMMGAYVQGGYFPHYAIPVIPKSLEVAFRYAFVDPDVDENYDTNHEYTVAFNWFFAGHRNKLTLDGSRMELSQPGTNRTENRIRFQWDVSF